MPYKINDSTYGNTENDNLDYKVNGDIVINAVTENGEKDNSRHNTHNGSDEITGELTS